jgi:hypothetical protein
MSKLFAVDSLQVGRIRAPKTTIAYVSGGVSTYALDINSRFALTLGGATTQLGVPTDLVEGDEWVLEIIQDGVGNRALTFAAAYDFGSYGAPDLTAFGAGVRAVIQCIATTVTKIDCSYATGYGPA